jgi:hypothetical protein
MNQFVALPPKERRTVCEQAGAVTGLPAVSIEKDFWVCWVLRELFSFPGAAEQFTFKGGTSLSKGWGLIQRFSEDVDLVMDRGSLGFGGEAAPEAADSRKERERRLDRLANATRSHVQKSLLPLLIRRFTAALPSAEPWTLAIDSAVPDGQTLLFGYRSAWDTPGYVVPVVRIELGARSDTEPTGNPLIGPYLFSALPGMFSECLFPARSVLPVRTFWEKVSLIHEELLRGGEAAPRARLARHFYDLFCLLEAGVGNEALAGMDIFKRVAAHRAVFFPKRQEVRDSLKPGGLRLVPTQEQLPAWQRDYTEMRDMFFGPAPSFDKILARVGEFARLVNGSEKFVL